MKTKNLLKKIDLTVDMTCDINLMYKGYDGLSKETRNMCALFNRERKKLWKLGCKICQSMLKDYYNQRRK